jgi:hypothetical protein
MPFVKGAGRPEGSGRKPGSTNRRTEDKKKFNRDLHARLKAFGCDIDEEMAKAIFQKNYEMVKALQGLLPYVQPKWKDADMPIPVLEETFEDEDTDAILEALQ